jgi:hypothetical protein
VKGALLSLTQQPLGSQQDIVLLIPAFARESQITEGQ